MTDAQQCPSCGRPAYVGLHAQVECSSLRCFLHPKLHHAGLDQRKLLELAWELYDEVERRLGSSFSRRNAVQAGLTRAIDALIG